MSHLSYEQRYTIEVLLCQGKKQIEIADIISRNKSVVSREIRRNCDQRSGVYKAKLAQSKYDSGLCSKSKSVKVTTAIEQQIIKLLEQDYSPEQISGYMKKEGLETMSHEWIYQLVWKDKKSNGNLHTHLRRKGRRYRKRGSSKDSRGIIKNRVSIDQRPNIVEKRERFGDLEVDLIIGKNHKQAILTINDRASGMLKMKKVKSKNADEVTQAINDVLEEWIPYIQTITADNGKEFAGHQNVAEFLKIDYYFAHPYHSWERGSNENLNGLVRQYFKKGTDFDKIIDQRIDEIENKLNNRPRKRHKYETPIFVMEKLLFNSGVALVS
jgi:IS30 family transposase|tara:strand:+ start:288 stop:1265 length:978 start_codon:yes stop_codon:yes gene_type:complete